MRHNVNNWYIQVKGTHEFIILFFQDLKFFQNKKFKSLKSDKVADH